MNLDCNQNFILAENPGFPFRFGSHAAFFFVCATAFSNLFGVRFSLFNTLSAAMFSLSFVLLICAISVYFNLLKRLGSAFAEASLLENLVLPDPKPALITDLSAFAATAKILPPDIEFLTDLSETNQPKFDRLWQP